MKTRNTINKLITMTMAVAAMAVIGSIWMAEPASAARRSDINDIYVFRSPVGIIDGQSVRISVGNRGSSTGWFRYQTTNPGGVPLYESERIQVPPGEFRFSDVSRRDLNTEGEPRTGRAQVMVTATIQAPAGSNPEDFTVSMEVIKEGTGATSGRILLHEFGHYMDTNTPEAASIGFIPGQRLSLSVINPSREEGSQTVRVQAYIYDSYGNLLRRTDPVELPPGLFCTFNFDRDDLRLAGEPDTGRLEVRAGIQVALMDGSVRTVKLPGSMELVNKSTGATTVYGGNYFTGTVTVSGEGFD